MCVCVFRSLSFFVRSAIFFHGISCHCHTIAVALFFAQTRRANAFCARTQPKVTLKLLDADELVSARSPVAFNLNLDNSLRFGTPEFPESLKFRGNFNISPKEVDAINGGNCFRNSASLLLGTDESSSLTLGKRSQLQCIPNYYYEDANRRCKTEKMYIRQKNTQLSEKAAERNELKKRIFTNKWHCFRFCAEHSKRQCNYFPYVAVSCHEKKVLKCVPFFFLFLFLCRHFCLSFFAFFWIYDVARSSVWSATNKNKFSLNRHNTARQFWLFCWERSVDKAVALGLLMSDWQHRDTNIPGTSTSRWPSCLLHVICNKMVEERMGKKRRKQKQTKIDICVRFASLNAWMLCRRVRSHTFEQQQPACGRTTNQQAKVPPIRFSSSRHQPNGLTAGIVFQWFAHSCDKDRRARGGFEDWPLWLFIILVSKTNLRGLNIFRVYFFIYIYIRSSWVRCMTFLRNNLSPRVCVCVCVRERNREDQITHENE